MPGKRNFRKKRKLNLKQKKLLAKRLIEISMKIDDCVYKNCEISAKDAVAYIAEMATCKPLCAGDARSLQVIEKITRCMNAVLAEQEPNKDTNEDIPADYSNENEPNQTYCPSPVYSLPDADKTFLTHSNTVNRQTASVTFAPDIETIDISDDDDVTANIVQVEVDIHRAMSNLSVQDKDCDDGDDCSQSILVNNDPLIIRDDTYDNMATNKGFSSFNVSNTTSTTMKVNNDITQKTPTPVNNIKANSLKTPITQQNTSNTDVVFNKLNKKKRGGKENVVKNNDNGKDKKTRQRNIKNFNNKTGKTNKTKKNKANEKKDSQPNNITMKNTPSATNNKETNITQNVTNNKAMSTTNTEERNKINVINTKATNPYMKTQLVITTRNTPVIPTTDLMINKAMEKVYNRNIENDLSWLENIRYVREVATEEYIGTAIDIDDNFWNNLYLPQAWDDKYFEY